MLTVWRAISGRRADGIWLQMNPVPVLLIGPGLGTLGAIRLLHRAGIVSYCYGGQGIEAHSRWYRPAPSSDALRVGGRRCASENAQPGKIEQLAAYLRQCPLDTAVLIPCSDAACRAIGALPADLRARFPSSTPSAAILEQLCDKAQFGELLSALDLPRPFTATIETSRQLAGVPRHIFDNAFLKPRDSQSFCARFGKKAFRVGSVAQAQSRLEAPLALGLGMVLQEYIPGPASNHMLIDGLRDRNGRICGMLARRRHRMYPLDFGNSSYMESTALDAVPGAVAALEKLLGHIDYRGIFSAEFKQDERDGLFKLIEINSRVWWFVEFTGRCGVDVCTMSWLDALGEPVPRVDDYLIGARFVHAYYDLFAGLALTRQGQTSMPRHLASWLGAQHPHFVWSDPVPAVVDMAAKVSGMVRRWMSRAPVPAGDEDKSAQVAAAAEFRAQFSGAVPRAPVRMDRDPPL